MNRKLRRVFKIGLGSFLVLGVAGVLSESAQAQMFGAPRQVGRPIQSRSGPNQSQSQIGSLQGNERFMRENRSTRDFVGSSRAEGDGFVGSVQSLGTGRVTTAAETLQPPPDAAARLNQPIPPLAAGSMYYPRLVLQLETQAISGEQVAHATTKRIESVLPAEVEGISIVVLDRRAVIRGSVTDEAMRRRIEILVSFEPGIDSIDNQLIVSQQ